MLTSAWISSIVIGGKFASANSSILSKRPIHRFAAQEAGPFDSGILATGDIPGARYDYAAAPPAIVDYVARIADVCRTFAIPLAATALQFSLAHPAVASVVTGMRSAGEVARKIARMRVEIPLEFWPALQRANLLVDAAAIPQ